jgi:hypothetical protein
MRKSPQCSTSFRLGLCAELEEVAVEQSFVERVRSVRLRTLDETDSLPPRVLDPSNSMYGKTLHLTSLNEVKLKQTHTEVLCDSSAKIPDGLEITKIMLQSTDDL